MWLEEQETGNLQEFRYLGSASSKDNGTKADVTDQDMEAILIV